MKGVKMVDGAGTRAAEDGDYVEFLVAGARAVGAYHCSSCAYGVTVHGVLPACPMCAGESWEPAPWSPFAQRADRLQ
jgi:hypothetical protein